MEKQQIISKLTELTKKAGRILLFSIAVVLGYAVCEIYHFTKAPKTVTTAKETKSIQETSVAINERGELMVIDRKSGDYTIYQDSVGRSIFNLYANSIQSRYVQPLK